MKKFKILLAVLILFTAFESAAQNKLKTTSRKVPKYTISFLGGFSYVLSNANGDASGFQAIYREEGGNIFTADNLGMQQGYGIMAIGKVAIDKKRKTRITANMGFNFFYNMYDGKRNRTLWNIFNLGTGIEYNFSPKQKERLFAGCEVNFSILYGGWQSDISYPDGYVSNIYTRFKPAGRFGIALTTGMEFRLSRKIDLVVAIRGVWSNAFPKQNYESNKPFESYINDAGSHNGIQLNGKKDIIFMQITTGITLPISYR